MKKFRKLLLLLPLSFTLGACGQSGDGSNSIDLSGLISNSSGGVEDFVKDFMYQTSVANAKLTALANADGYSFTIRAEHEVIPDDKEESTYFNIILSAKNDITWATVDIVKKDNTVIGTYQAVYEESNDITYINDGEDWHSIVLQDYNLPYTIKDIKDLLILGGQYLPKLSYSDVVKTRTTEAGRECIKYNLKTGSTNELTVLVDRYTQLLIHFTNINYGEKAVTKDLIKITEFKEVAPALPSYK